MLFQQEFYLFWASLELFMSLTHLFVFLGVRNSKLGFIRRQHNYFLLDGFTHLINVFLHSPSTVGLPIYCLWIYAFFVHLYYYQNLKTNPPPRRGQENQTDDNSHKIARIFHWSCVEFEDNRFSLTKSGRQMLETAIDVTNHTAGFVMAFRMLDSVWYKLLSMIVMFALLNRQMLTLKYFLTDPKMMPPMLQRFFAGESTNTKIN